MQNIQTMIDQHGGFEAVRTRYLRLENPPFMRLVIEVIGGPYPNGAYELSIAHYSEQNGDAMRDPEITFLVVPTARKLLLRGPGRVGYGRGAGTGCEGV